MTALLLPKDLSRPVKYKQSRLKKFDPPPFFLGNLASQSEVSVHTFENLADVLLGLLGAFARLLFRFLLPKSAKLFKIFKVRNNF